jgi:hypothetical protein
VTNYQPTMAESSTTHHSMFVFRHFRSTSRRHSSCCAFVSCVAAPRTYWSSPTAPDCSRFSSGSSDDLASILERVMIYSASVYAVGDFSIRLDRPDDASAVQYHSLLEGFRFNISSTGPIHARGDMLDAVASIAAIITDVIDAGISDHHTVLRHIAPGLSPVSTTAVPRDSPATVRPWRCLHITASREAEVSSILCRRESWPADIVQLGTHGRPRSASPSQLVIHQTTRQQSLV